MTSTVFERKILVSVVLFLLFLDLFEVLSIGSENAKTLGNQIDFVFLERESDCSADTHRPTEQQ